MQAGPSSFPPSHPAATQRLDIASTNQSFETQIVCKCGENGVDIIYSAAPTLLRRVTVPRVMSYRVSKKRLISEGMQAEVGGSRSFARKCSNFN